MSYIMYARSHIAITLLMWFDNLHKAQCNSSVFPTEVVFFFFFAVVFFHSNSFPFGVMFLVKPFTIVGLITVFITHRPTQSREFRGRGSSNSDSPWRLICQPCETSGQGLVMWFRWVSHAAVSQPSPLSAPATVPHYTPCHHQPYRQQALPFLTLGHPFFFLAKITEENMEGVGNRRVYE